MLPGPHRLLVAGEGFAPRRIAVEGLQALDGQVAKLVVAVAVMFDRGIVDGKDALAVQPTNDHRHRVGIEQESERGLALLQLVDVGSDIDDTGMFAVLFMRFARVGDHRVREHASRFSPAAGARDGQRRVLYGIWRAGQKPGHSARISL